MLHQQVLRHVVLLVSGVVAPGGRSHLPVVDTAAEGKLADMSPIGRLHHVILDCPDPHALAAFYSRLLGKPVTYADDDFVVVADNDRTSGLAFQRAPDHRPPTWPEVTVPQQIHLDVMVEDVAEAAPRVLALGATKLPGDGVFADPAGHPFCLIRRPGWAPPLAG
jgi:catechol 2,3-dioxygenase-like lactoylglutathione lyase family enzyme